MSGTVYGFLFGFIAGLSCITRAPAPHRNAAADPLAATPDRWAMPFEAEDEMERARR